MLFKAVVEVRLDFSVHVGIFSGTEKKHLLSKSTLDSQIIQSIFRWRFTPRKNFKS